MIFGREPGEVAAGVVVTLATTLELYFFENSKVRVQMLNGRQTLSLHNEWTHRVVSMAQATILADSPKDGGDDNSCRNCDDHSGRSEEDETRRRDLCTEG